VLHIIMPTLPDRAPRADVSKLIIEAP
jgi:glycerol-3-phosphate dehydrogenase